MALPFPSPFPFLHQLLAKAVAIRAANLSIDDLTDATDREYTRANYILMVLRASPATRFQVRNLCLASNSLGQKHLAAILTMFEVMSADKKANFIQKFVTTSTLGGQGPMWVAMNTVWEPGHTPPCPPTAPGCNEP